MNYQFDQRGDVTILSVDNLMFDYENRQLLDQVVDKINDGYKQFIIDLSLLEFTNSVGLSFLISVLTKSRNVGGETIVTNISPKIGQLLIMTKLNSIFTVCDNVEEAVEALNTMFSPAVQ